MEIRLQESDLVGTFRTPEGSGPFPGVLALGGSDGGTPEYFLKLCVSEGFACLALVYWGTSDTPATMVEIPLERIERGLRWLLGRADVSARNGRAAVVGASKGGELALLLASTFPIWSDQWPRTHRAASCGLAWTSHSHPGRRARLGVIERSHFRTSRFRRMWLRLALNEASPCCHSPRQRSMITTPLNEPRSPLSARMAP